MAEALARLIVPSDEETPGIDEVCVLDPPAMVTLDKILSTSSSSARQRTYARGLLSFDLWALKERGCKFAQMPEESQKALFQTAQQIHEEWTGSMPVTRKALCRLRSILCEKREAILASLLYPQIRGDCLRIFYTSRVSWTWLEYDGPPMDKGYSRLTMPREDLE